jgi:hypothetical protein
MISLSCQNSAILDFATVTNYRLFEPWIELTGSWGVSLSLHFSHTEVWNVTLGVVRLKLDQRMLWISQAVYFLYRYIAH